MRPIGIRTNLYEKFNDDTPKINFKLEVFSFNEFGYTIYYPKYYYSLDIQRLQLISGVTNTKPFYLFNKWPTWVNEEKLQLK